MLSRREHRAKRKLGLSNGTGETRSQPKRFHSVKDSKDECAQSSNGRYDSSRRNSATTTARVRTVVRTRRRVRPFRSTDARDWISAQRCFPSPKCLGRATKTPPSTAAAVGLCPAAELITSTGLGRHTEGKRRIAWKASFSADAVNQDHATDRDSARIWGKRGSVASFFCSISRHASIDSVPSLFGSDGASLELLT